MELHLTSHAKRRRKAMGVTEHEILLAVTDPETVYPGTVFGRWSYQRGRIVVITNARRDTVVTVLWHRKEGR